MSLKKALIIAFVSSILFTACKEQNTIEGDKLFEAGKYQEAIKIYDEFLKLNPTDLKSIYNRSRAYEELAEFSKAFEGFQAVLELDAKNTNAMLSIATHHYRNGAYDNAAFYAEKVIGINNQLPQAFLWLGKSKHQLGDFNKALQAYQSAISLNENLGEAYLFRGMLYTRLNSSVKGCTDLKKAVSLNTPEAAELLAKYCN